MFTIPISPSEAWSSRVDMGPRNTTTFYIFCNNDVVTWRLCPGVIRITCAQHQNREKRKIWENRLRWRRHKSLKWLYFDFTSKRGQVKCRCKLVCLPIWSEEFLPVVYIECAVFAPLYSMVRFIMLSICGYWFLGFLPVMMISAYAITEIFCCLDQNITCCMSHARREIRLFERRATLPYQAPTAKNRITYTFDYALSSMNCIKLCSWQCIYSYIALKVWGCICQFFRSIIL